MFPMVILFLHNIAGISNLNDLPLPYMRISVTTYDIIIPYIIQVYY